MNKIKSIQFPFSESPTLDTNTVHTSWNSANAALADASRSVTRGYDKTEFLITWEDGYAYGGRLDLNQQDNNLSKDMKERAIYLLGPASAKSVRALYGVNLEGMQNQWLKILTEYSLTD